LVVLLFKVLKIMLSIEQRLKEIKVVPVIAINDENKAALLAKVLVENGLPCAEVTFRTPAAAESIRLMREAYPDMLIGAGTILNNQQVDEAIAAGVDFIVSPGLNPTTVQYCQEKNIAIIPGVNNPSLVEQAMAMGLKTLKFFPAEPSGGIPMLKALSAVYPVSFMPTGGVSPANVADYLALESVVACGGTWMVPNNLINNADWKGLAALVKAVNN
jgi:2-dehydro-3-deoxyphosphogluconate aldolase/(4S)-4-hydroxy-2-oxoglutarate aldolase